MEALQIKKKSHASCYRLLFSLSAGWGRSSAAVMMVSQQKKGNNINELSLRLRMTHSQDHVSV